MKVLPDLAHNFNLIMSLLSSLPFSNGKDFLFILQTHQQGLSFLGTLAYVLV